jgi:hypothetical protein
MVAIARELALLVWLTKAVTVSRNGWWPFTPLLHKCSETNDVTGDMETHPLVYPASRCTYRSTRHVKKKYVGDSN